MRLDQNSVCLVTGGVMGLGRASVDSFLAKSCKVIVADFNQQQGNDLQNKHPNQITFIKTDVSNEDQVKKLISQILTKFSKIDVIVNCAGILTGEVIATNKKTLNNLELDKVMSINVIGTFNIIKHFIRLAKLQKSNQEKTVIINVASVAAFEGQRGTTTYAASKGAIAGLTKPLAIELKEYGVRVISIAPSVFQTPMGKDLQHNVQLITGYQQSIALGRLGEAHEFAQLVTGVCMAEGINGEIIRIDGASRLPLL